MMYSSGAGMSGRLRNSSNSSDSRASFVMESVPAMVRLLLPDAVGQALLNLSQRLLGT